MKDFEWALCQIRRRGPAFVNLLTTHAQGGSALVDVVDPHSFRVRTDDGQTIENLTVADASVFPAGCEINPQLTLKALATIAAQRIIDRSSA
jgi:choline dehydrogenase-like flavoprotein